MEYGSIFGHGAYLGPDFTADYLHRAAEIVTREYGGTGSDTARQQVIEDFKTNRYDAASGALTYTAAQAVAFDGAGRLLHGDYFGATSSAEKGLRPDAITDPDRDPAAHVVLLLDGMGRLDAAAGQGLLVHQQLAAGAARRQRRPPPTSWCGACSP